MTPINWWALPNPLPPQKNLLSYSPSPPQKQHGHLTSSTATRTLCGMGENHEKGQRLSVSGILLPEKTPPTPHFWRWQNTTPRTGSWSIKICGKKTGRKPKKGKGIVIFQLSFFQGQAVSFQGCEANGDEISQFRSGKHVFLLMALRFWKDATLQDLYETTTMWCDMMIWYQMIWWYNMQR